MPLNTIERPSDSDLRKVLEKARRNLKAGRNVYLCYALDAVTYHHPQLKPAGVYLRKYVRHVLGDHAYLESWQRARRGEPAWGISIRTKAEQRADRIAWVNWLLEGL